MNYEVTQETKRLWKIGTVAFIEQVANAPKPKFDVCTCYSLDEEKLRQLHATIGQCLTDLAAEQERGENREMLEDVQNEMIARTGQANPF